MSADRPRVGLSLSSALSFGTGRATLGNYDIVTARRFSQFALSSADEETLNASRHYGTGSESSTAGLESCLMRACCCQLSDHRQSSDYRTMVAGGGSSS